MAYICQLYRQHNLLMGKSSKNPLGFDLLSNSTNYLTIPTQKENFKRYR